MKKNIRHTIIRLTLVIAVICYSYFSATSQAIELGTAYTDSFCVAIPKPLGLDTINWDDERDSCIAMLKKIAIENAIEAWRDSVARLIQEHIRLQ
ncbi:MAG: hypothetical protein WAT91_10575, partial [Saprospiraceae bacterium]